MSQFLPLAVRPIGRFDPGTDDPSPGRRLRVLAALIYRADGALFSMGTPDGHMPLGEAGTQTYAQFLARLQEAESPDLVAAREVFAALPLRVGAQGPLLHSLPEDRAPGPRDPDLHPALQDLGNEINEDIREALESLDDAHAYYPGIDEGIEPVSDEHVSLVIWALQRELDRELRTGSGSFSGERLPAAPLSALPWEVQRALAERRRWRYRQWGLGREQWLQGSWSVWEVPLDPDYLPRRALRLASASTAKSA